MNNIKVELFGNDPKIQKAISIARNVSVTKASVLVTGEIGVGKKSLAQFIHNSSNRADQCFQIIDCAGESKEVENKILGCRDSETGRFTKGVLETTNKGTIVFANVEALEDGFQKRLHKIFHQLSDYDIDIRIIATTTKNLSKLVGSGRFYRGLYTYISSNQINLTPIRERAEDLQMFVNYFVNIYSLQFGKEVSMGQDTMDRILSHYWTHNIHELKTVLEKSVEGTESNIMSANDLAIGEKKAVSIISEEDGEGIRLMSLKEAEKLLIKKALIHTSENRTQAAKILGVSIRTLRNKINEYRNSGSSYFVNLR